MDQEEFANRAEAIFQSTVKVYGERAAEGAATLFFVRQLTVGAVELMARISYAAREGMEVAELRALLLDASEALNVMETGVELQISKAMKVSPNLLDKVTLHYRELSKGAWGVKS